MDLDNYCRCCLSKTRETKNINSFIDVGGKLGKIKIILSDCLNLKAEIGDGYPQNVCGRCVSLLRKISSFKSTALKSYKYIEAQYNTIKSETDIQSLNGVETKYSVKEEKLAEFIDKELKLPDSNEANDECGVYDEEGESGTPLFYCICCDAKFACKEELYQHCCASHTPLNRSGQACEYCNERFPYSSILTMHKRKHLTPYVCPWCLQGFSASLHFQTHTQDCEKFEDVYASRTKIRPPRKKEKCQCQYCGKSYAKDYIASHMKIHKEGTYVCKICGKAFAQRTPFKEHMYVHSDVKQYKCSQCDTTFKSRSNRFKHIKNVHMKQKNKICDTCGKGFFSKSSLLKHLPSHTGIKAFNCHLCEKAYQAKSGLQVHLKSHELAV